MPLSLDRIREIVLSTLGPQDRESCAVYLGDAVFERGETVRIDETETSIPWRARLAFIDLEPMANWGHSCRYLLINDESGELRSIDARFPPSQHGEPSTLRLLWKAQAVPSWTVLSDEPTALDQ